MRASFLAAINHVKTRSGFTCRVESEANFTRQIERFASTWQVPSSISL